MGSYASADGPTRWKAMTAVAVVHVALGAIILNGLNVSIVRQAVERMQTFDIPLPKPPPPPPPPPPPKEQPREQKADEGAPEKEPAPSPIVAPTPVLPVKSPVRATDVAGTGSASSAGAGGRGTGTGLGGTGTGTGTGSGDGRGFTPAQRISRIPNSEYRRLVRASGMRNGRVGIMVKVNIDGNPSNCRIMRSSGNPVADSLICELTLRYVRFRPARDPLGRPVAQDMGWSPDWSPLR